MGKMKILHLLSQTQLTGAEVHAVEICAHLLKSGHQVWIVSDELRLQSGATQILLPVHRAKFFTKIKTALILQKLIHLEGIEVVHSHSRAAARIASLASLFHSFLTRSVFARITTFHGKHPPSFSKRWRNIYGEDVISVCENLRDFHITQKVSLHKTHHLIRNPIQLSLESPRPSSQIRGAIAGRFSGPKGERIVFLLCEVFPKLLNDFPNFTLDVMGGGLKDLSPANQESLQTLLKKFPDRLRLMGHQANLEQVLHNYNLVFCGGRIAVEALGQGAWVASFGEASFEGFMTKENFHQQLKSNFGDITLQNQPWNAGQISQHLTEGLSNWSSLKTDRHQELQAMAKDEFDAEVVCARIERLYECARAKSLRPQFLPILMYHKVVTEPLTTPHRIFITAANFEEHLKTLKKQGFTAIHFKDLKTFRVDAAKHPLPKKPVMLTFDDGYVNNLEIALPLLEKYQMKATVFLLAKSDLPSNIWDLDSGDPQLPLMNAIQRKIFSAHPLIEIGSHGFSHKRMDRMTAEERWHELKDSKTALEKELGVEVDVYAYTYGIRLPEASLLAFKAGYSYAVNTDTGGLHHEDDPYSIFRVSIFPEDGPAQILKKTSGWYRKYYFWKRGK